MNKPNGMFDRRGPGTAFVVAAVLFGTLALMVGVKYFSAAPKKDILFSDFVTLVDDGRVASVSVLSNQSVNGVLKDGTSFETQVISADSMIEKFSKAGVVVAVAAQDNFAWFYYLMGTVLGVILLMVVFGVIAYFRYVQDGGSAGNGKIFSVGKSKARFFSANEVNVRFTDVAGLEESKYELDDIIKFLQNPKKFGRIGAKIPRGILLSGEPGNGKTLLAKAVAGEAGVPFFSISGSDFVEVFVGVGASRVRDLFLQARKHSPCIVFIDEIDAVGRKRGVGTGGGNDEREQTLNQLLAEMDGFETMPGAVIILAATNRVDVLDKALMRPGRFDRVVEVGFPDIKSREKILKVHASKVKIASDVNLEKIARGTSGFSGAQLANLINEAALAATKIGKKEVDVHDFEFARDKLIIGSEQKHIVLTVEETEKTAFHEAGHALLNILLPETDPFHKVTIVPHGRALGVSWSLPERDSYSQDSEDMISRIIVALGGITAEKLVYQETTSGVASDLQAATNIARLMVSRYGMSRLGPITYLYPDGSAQHSEATAEKIDEEVRRIMSECLEKAKSLLTEHRLKLDLLAKELVNKETLVAEEVYKLLDIEPRELHSFHPDVSIEEVSTESESQEESQGDIIEDEGTTPGTSQDS